MRPSPKMLLDYREFPVLYVDDEPENLRVFQIAMRESFTVFTASSGEEGLRLLHEHPVAVVLSDQRMPEMSGAEFLARVRQVDEMTVRMLVTAFGDTDTLHSAINDGAIYRYVPKPWEPVAMREAIRAAIDVYALDRERESLLDELVQLNHVSRALYAELELEPLCQLLVQSAHGDLRFDGATLLLAEPAGDVLRWVASAPANATLDPALAAIRLTDGHAPRFFERLGKAETQVLKLDRVNELEPALRQWATELSAEEIVVTPLVGKRGLLGALAVDNRSGARELRVEQRTLLEGLATQAVIAIENAQLVDEIRRSRAQVLRADRLGTLGTLAAGLAHEINNPLATIHTFLSLAPEKREDPDPEFWGAYHARASRELERIRTLIATMSDLARGGLGGAAEICSVDLGEIAREVGQLLAHEARSAGVELCVETDPDAPAVLGARDQLHQVVLNLALNAVQATPAGGRVDVVVGPDPSAPETASIVRVTDTGSGIPEAERERIFDPFFTTKAPDRGTGLGLMICHQVVADHGGEIEVHSRPGEGSSFQVRLLVRSLSAGEGARH